MTEDTHKKGEWSTVRLDSSVFDLLYEEQVRLRKQHGRKLSYSEILRRMFSVYLAADLEKLSPKSKHPVDPLVTPTSHEERIAVAALLFAWRENSDTAKLHKEVILDLLSSWLTKAKSLLNNNHEISA